MATPFLSSLHSQYGSFLLHSTTAVSRSATRFHLKSFKNNVNSYTSCCKNPGSEGKPREQSLSKRRELLLHAGIAAFPLSAFPSVVFAENVAVKEPRVYSDDVNKYKISIPSDWEVGTGEGDGVRSLIAFYPQEASNSNVSIVITSLGADFTRLESFGKVDEFAENLVSGLDRSWKRPPGVAAKLIDCKSANGLYYIDYTLQNPGQSLRHLFTVLGIANNGFYNRLYTITGQFVDEEAEKYGAEVEKVHLIGGDFWFDILMLVNNGSKLLHGYNCRHTGSRMVGGCLNGTHLLYVYEATIEYFVFRHIFFSILSEEMPSRAVDSAAIA